MLLRWTSCLARPLGGQVKQQHQNILVTMHALSLLDGDESLFKSAMSVFESPFPSRKKSKMRTQGLVSVWSSWKKANNNRVFTDSRQRVLVVYKTLDLMMFRLENGGGQ